MTLNILLVLIGSLLILLFYLWWLRSEGQKTKDTRQIVFRDDGELAYRAQRARKHNLPAAPGLDRKRVS